MLRRLKMFQGSVFPTLCIFLASCLLHTLLEIVVIRLIYKFKLLLFKIFPLYFFYSSHALTNQRFTYLRFFDCLGIALLVLCQMLPLPSMFSLFLYWGDLSLYNLMKLSTLDVVREPMADLFALPSLFWPLLVDFLLLSKHFLTVILPVKFQIIRSDCRIRKYLLPLLNRFPLLLQLLFFYSLGIALFNLLVKRYLS